MKVWGYLDAGGTHSNPDREGKTSPAVSVAGFLATPLQWKGLDKQWKERLDQDHLRYFHMSSFMANRDIFEKCKNWTQERRDKLVSDLAWIIFGNVTYGLGMAVFRQDYQEVINQLPIAAKVLGTPYAFCSYRCIESGTDWASRAKSNDAIRYIFERGDPGCNEVLNTHTFMCKSETLRERYRISAGSLTFEDGVKTRPLQAADLLAWEMGAEYKRRFYPEPEAPYTRDSLACLMSIPGDYKEYPKADLEQYLDQFVSEQRGFLIPVPHNIAHKRTRQ